MNPTTRILPAALSCMALAASSALAAPPATPPALGWPVSSADSYYMTAGFDLDPGTGRADWTGWRSNEATAGNGHAYDGHSGTDWGMVTGTNLYAVANGTVSSLRESVPNDDHSDTGNYLIIDHTNIGGRNYRTRFWHLAQNGVIPVSGAAVTKGQLVASSDNTGNSTGPHLHYATSLLSGDLQTCPFYHAWWENDEFYYGDTRPCLAYVSVNSGPLNCREGNTTSYSIITSLPAGAQLVSTQRNAWWRLMLPLPPAKPFESTIAGGGLAPGYSEGGTWAADSGKSTVADAAGDANRVSLSGTGSRSSTFSSTGDPADTATFSFTVPEQRGNYDIYATWPSTANALNVTYRISDANGTTDVVVDQKGSYGGAGTGTKADPFRISRNPYVANHTTIGAPDEWDSYSPTGAGIPENGPENLYRFELRKTSDVTVSVEHSGYPTLDIDIHLLTGPSNTTCIRRADWSFTQTALAPGTYYIAADSYGSNNNAATAYTLRVTFSETEPFPDSWVKLGSFFYDRNAAGSVQVREASVTGKVDAGSAGRVFADAIKVVPRIYRRSGWASDTLLTRINTAVTPVSCVVVRVDNTTNYESREMDDYVEVPIYANPGTGTSNTSTIVGKAVTGQRFVCTGSAGDWYKVMLTNGTAAPQGWILGDLLAGYRTDKVSNVPDWSLY